MGVLPSDAHFDPYNETYFQLIVTEIFSPVMKSIYLTEESSLSLFEINSFPFLFSFYCFLNSKSSGYRYRIRGKERNGVSTFQ